MYERMLDKQALPTMEEMTAYCGETAALFTQLNAWLSDTLGTEQKVVFPYGNHYGWGIRHRKKQKLVCTIFAEANAFTVMLRLSDEQFKSAYNQLQKYAQAYIDNRYPCSNGGWIHYRVADEAQFDDIQKLLSVKCTESRTAGRALKD